jgi:hypothetical protein
MLQLKLCSRWIKSRWCPSKQRSTLLATDLESKIWICSCRAHHSSSKNNRKPMKLCSVDCGCFDSQNNRKPIKLCFVVVAPWALFLLIDNYSAKSKPERVLPNRSLTSSASCLISRSCTQYVVKALTGSDSSVPTCRSDHQNIGRRKDACKEKRKSNMTRPWRRWQRIRNGFDLINMWSRSASRRSN